MADESTQTGAVEHSGADLRSVIENVINEYVSREQTRMEPVYKTELLEERKKRERLEQRLNELVEENRRARAAAEEADRSATIRSELQKLGVAKIELAYRAIKEDIQRADDGRLYARNTNGEVPLREYLTNFVGENPELLPARITGGSGASSGPKAPNSTTGTLDLDRIKPGMNAEELAHVRAEIARVAAQAMRGQ